MDMISNHLRAAIIEAKTAEEALAIIIERGHHEIPAEGTDAGTDSGGATADGSRGKDVDHVALSKAKAAEPKLQQITLTFDPSAPLGLVVDTSETREYVVSELTPDGQALEKGCRVGACVVSVAGKPLGVNPNGGSLDNTQIAARLNDAVQAARTRGTTFSIVVEQDRILSPIELKDARFVIAGVLATRKKGLKQPQKRWVVVMHPPYPDGKEHCAHGSVVLYDLRNCKTLPRKEGGGFEPRARAFDTIDKGVNCSDIWRFSMIDAAASHQKKDVRKMVRVVNSEVRVTTWSDKAKDKGPKDRILQFGSATIAQRWGRGLVAMLQVHGHTIEDEEVPLKEQGTEAEQEAEALAEEKLLAEPAVEEEEAVAAAVPGGNGRGGGSLRGRGRGRGRGGGGGRGYDPTYFPSSSFRTEARQPNMDPCAPARCEKRVGRGFGRRCKERTETWLAVLYSGEAIGHIDRDDSEPPRSMPKQPAPGARRPPTCPCTRPGL
jgi:hypothetical protein